MKIYIDNIKYKAECTEKELHLRVEEVLCQVKELQKDKGRMEELMSLKDSELAKIKREAKEIDALARETERRIQLAKAEASKLMEDKYRSQIGKMKLDYDKMKNAYLSS